MKAVTSAISHPIANKAHLLVGLFAILWCLVPQSASAHASLISTSPVDGAELSESPSAIELEFSEPVGLVDGGNVLHGSDAEPLPIEALTRGSLVVIDIPDPLADGAYILQWRVISADGHPISGALSFAVGDSEGEVVIADQSGSQAWIKWARDAAVAIKYIGFLGAFGVLLVGRIIISGDETELWSLSAILAGFGIVGVVGELPLEAMLLRGETFGSLSEVGDAIGGLPNESLLSAGISMLAVLGMFATRRYRSASILLLGMPLLVLLLSGHTRSREPIWVMMLSDAAHLCAGAVWLGGILLLVLGLIGRWKGKGFDNQQSQTGSVSRFSALAIYTAIIVLVSGALMAFTILDEFRALYQSPWGRALLLKICLVCVVLILAAANRWVFIPRISRNPEESLRKLRILVIAELIALLAIAGASGSLVHRDPTVQAESQAAVTVAETSVSLDAEHSANIWISSIESSSTAQVEVRIIDDEGVVVNPEGDVQIDWYLPSQELGPISQTLEQGADEGSFTGKLKIPLSGEWRVEITAGIDRFTDSRGSITVEIP